MCVLVCVYTEGLEGGLLNLSWGFARLLLIARCPEKTRPEELREAARGNWLSRVERKGVKHRAFVRNKSSLLQL